MRWSDVEKAIHTGDKLTQIDDNYWRITATDPDTRQMVRIAITVAYPEQ